MEFNLIYATDTIDRLQTHYPDIVESALESGNLKLYSLEEPPSSGMKASRPEGDTLVLVFYSGQSGATMLVANKTVGAVARFDETFHTPGHE
jgi:hypothetical protein